MGMAVMTAILHTWQTSAQAARLTLRHRAARMGCIADMQNARLARRFTLSGEDKPRRGRRMCGHVDLKFFAHTWRACARLLHT